MSTAEVAALPAGRGPVGVERGEACIASVKGVVILELAGLSGFPSNRRRHSAAPASQRRSSRAAERSCRWSEPFGYPLLFSRNIRREAICWCFGHRATG